MLNRFVNVRRDELSALLWCAAAFFCVLCSYMILRPVRDAMGIAAGVGNLKWLFTATFGAMLVASPLFAALTSRVGRRRFVPWLYHFFALNLFGFFLSLRLGAQDPQAGLAQGLYIWISVFNLFSVSVFWALMADLFRREQSQRLFGFIAGGGSLGALVGPALTALLVEHVGVPLLLLLSGMLLEAGVFCLQRRMRVSSQQAAGAGSAEQPLGGGMLEGAGLILRSPLLLKIAGYVLLTSLIGTFLYFHQAHVVRAALEGTQARTALFARMDLSVNLLALFGQVLVLDRVVRRFGMALTLAVLPGTCALGCLVLGLNYALWPVIAFQVAQRAIGFGTAVPASQMLFTRVSQAEKYKAKNLLDTVLARGGDVANGWLFAGLSALLSLPNVALVTVPICLAWVALAHRLGRDFSCAGRGQSGNC